MTDPLIGAVAELKRYAADEHGTASWLTKSEAHALLSVLVEAHPFISHNLRLPEGSHKLPTAAEVYELLREEYDALGRLSYTGDGNNNWISDLRRQDIEEIRQLLAHAAATIEAYS